jgi:8-oxo-dGTP diphosphatase
MNHSPSTASSTHIDVAIAVVMSDARYLVGIRPAGAALAGRAEFPGGKIAAGETPAEAACRECREETGIRVAVLEPLLVVEHDYPHGRLRLHFFACQPTSPAVAPHAPFRVRFSGGERGRAGALAGTCSTVVRPRMAMARTPGVFVRRFLAGVLADRTCDRMPA